MRFYRLLLRLCPGSIHRDFGAAMEEMFARRLADARNAGRWRLGIFWLREIAGLAGVAVSERFEQHGQRRRRARWKAGRMDRMTLEIRQAARRLLKSPAFTVPAMLTLALAIGANAAIFAVVHRVLLNPLPYGDSDRLVSLEFAIPSRNVPAIYFVTSRIYYQLMDRARSIDGIALYMGANELTLTGEGIPERIRVSRTTPSLALVLRVTPALGRWFTEAEGMPGASPVVVLSHGLWVRRYGQDPGVVGRTVTLDGVPTTVVGVMPASYAFPDPRIDVWVPVPMSRATASNAFNFAEVARLRDGATLADARSELTRLTAELEPEFPNNGYKALVSTAKPLLDATVGSVSTTLWILLASVGLVLLIACANVANLFLVRSEVRQREIAVRRALGAGGRAIARYFLTESLLLSIAGGAIGLSLAWGATRLLIAFGPDSLPRLEDVRLDGVVLVFTSAMSLLTAVAFGSIPFLRFAPLAASLHDSTRSHTASRSRHRTRHLLMGGQIALALVLLVASGLMLRSFHELRAVDPGFDGSSALTFRIGFPRSDYPNRKSVVAAHHAILDRLSTLPGVTAVSASTCLPLSEAQLCQAGPLFIDGRPLPTGTLIPIVAIRAVAGGYFEAMGMRPVRGRTLDRRDVEQEEPVVIVNEAVVKTTFPNQDPIGQRVRLGNPSLTPGAPDWFTIVGVVSNTPTFGLAEVNPFPQLFFPMFASRPMNMAPRLDAMSYVVRTALAPEALMPPLRNAIGQQDANLAIAQVRTLQDVLDRASAQLGFTMVLLVIAAAVGMILGLIGIYGAMSYIVTQRTGEIGVRLALGETPSHVEGAIVRQGAIVMLAGIIAGLGAAFAGARLIESLLFGVSPREPRIFLATALLLLGVGLFACWLPARRAARLDPLEALRSE
jgi:predicted permease